jgi:regulator of PEP synthase PpsR (kinase-PPPase family)
VTKRLHLHLLSDSTGETLEVVAKASLAHFEDVEAIKHFWPMIRSEGHLDRVLVEVAQRPGLVLFTLANPEHRRRLETRCHALGLPVVATLDPVIDSLSRLLGQEARIKPGLQHVLDSAYFARVEAIQYTIAHDDGLLPDDWEEADIVLVGVSRSSKTPTSIYLANRGYKVANVPLVSDQPQPMLTTLTRPLVVGLTTGLDRLIQVRRNRLLSLSQKPDTEYVDPEAVAAEIARARRLFADHGWPVIDVSRRSIEETAAAVMNLYQERHEAQDA